MGDPIPPSRGDPRFQDNCMNARAQSLISESADDVSGGGEEARGKFFRCPELGRSPLEKLVDCRKRCEHHPPTLLALFPLTTTTGLLSKRKAGFFQPTRRPRSPSSQAGVEPNRAVITDHGLGGVSRRLFVQAAILGQEALQVTR